MVTGKKTAREPLTAPDTFMPVPSGCHSIGVAQQENRFPSTGPGCAHRLEQIQVLRSRGSGWLDPPMPRPAASRLEITIMSLMTRAYDP
jgi:hypothetical protein